MPAPEAKSLRGEARLLTLILKPPPMPLSRRSLIPPDLLLTLRQVPAWSLGRGARAPGPRMEASARHGGVAI